MRAHRRRPTSLLRVTTTAITLLAVLSTASACSGSDSAPPAPTSSPDAAAPATGSGRRLTVTRSTFTVTYRLDGATERSAAVGTDVPIGTVFRPAVPLDSVVTPGTRLGRLQVEPSLKKALDKDAGAGTVGESRRTAALAAEGPVVAAARGRLVLDDARQLRIEHPGIDVVVPLTPLQELRYRSMRFRGEASVETIVGQRTVACTGVWISVATPTNAPAEDGDGRSQVHCRLPDDVETAAGLPAVLTLAAPPVENAIAVPAYYLSVDDSGEDYEALVLDGTDPRSRPVVVGATDGVRRLVLSGLDSGDVIVPPPAQ